MCNYPMAKGAVLTTNSDVGKAQRKVALITGTNR
jgi:hypothetical protein